MVGCERGDQSEVLNNYTYHHRQTVPKSAPIINESCKISNADINQLYMKNECTHH